ncbi:MAG: hypothetical protein ACAH95_01595 [Fimbriimonas sp.]
MAYEYREPDVVETHTRETIVESDTGSSGAVLGIVLAALLVLGLIGYFAWWSPNNSSTTNVKVETPADTGRAQDINVTAPDVNVTAPDVNVSPPDITINPPANNGGSSSDNTTRDNAGSTTGQ